MGTRWDYICTEQKCEGLQKHRYSTKHALSLKVNYLQGVTS